MPVPSMLYTFAVELLLIDLGRYFQIRAPSSDRESTP